MILAFWRMGCACVQLGRLIERGDSSPAYCFRTAVPSFSSCSFWFGTDLWLPSTREVAKVAPPPTKLSMLENTCTRR